MENSSAQEKRWKTCFLPWLVLSRCHQSLEWNSVLPFPRLRPVCKFVCGPFDNKCPAVGASLQKLWQLEQRGSLKSSESGTTHIISIRFLIHVTIAPQPDAPSISANNPRSATAAKMLIQNSFSWAPRWWNQGESECWTPHCGVWWTWWLSSHLIGQMSAGAPSISAANPQSTITAEPATHLVTD